MKSGYKTGKCWRDQWTQSNIPNNNLVPDPNQGVMGMDLPRKEWSILNRIRTGHTCCVDMMHKWRVQYMTVVITNKH